MEVIGITAEYNPFHNGHVRQLEQARAHFGDCPVVAVMSGSFVQRGLPAITDKWTRAAMAVEAGVDLVLELPAAYVLRSADYFAAGAVRSLAATGLVTTLVCGMETPASGEMLEPDGISGSLSPKRSCDALTSAESLDGLPGLEETARCLLLPKTEALAGIFLDNGDAYGTAWSKALAKVLPGGERFLEGANNILALAYQKAILRDGLSLRLVPFPREGSGYLEKEIRPPYASATAIRKAVLEKTADRELLSRVMPKASLELLQDALPPLADRSGVMLRDLLAYLLLYKDGEHIYRHTNADRGLCDRLLKYRDRLSQGLEEYILAVSSKRYPRPAIRRTLVQLLLGRTRAFWKAPARPEYLRVLAFSHRGRVLLRTMKDTATLPVITKLGRLPRPGEEGYSPLLETDVLATDLQSQLLGLPGVYGRDFFTAPRYCR